MPALAGPVAVCGPASTVQQRHRNLTERNTEMTAITNPAPELVETICSDGQKTTVDAALVRELVTMLETAGIEPGDIDEDVHACCDMTASRWVNNRYTDLPLPAAQDKAYAETGTIGSDVNNGGLTAQVAFLIAEVGAANARELLTETAGKAA
jgi:hypothetical protein